MASMINKAKAAVTPNHTTTPSTHSEGVHGPHSSRVANAADPRIDSDRDGGHIGQDTHTSTGYGHNTTGTGAGYGTNDHSHTTGHGATTTAGPHSSNLMNKADPLVDSDRSGAGYGTTGHSSTTTAGPHSSNLMNKADPRVDSDRSGASHLGGGTGLGNTQHTTGMTGTHTGTHVPGMTGTHTGTHAPGMTGTHTGTHAGNTHGTHTGTTGGISHSTNAGPHNSNLANKADPRVDSDLDSTGNRHGAHTGGILGASGSHATPGSGTAQNTAGPHNSDLLNKLDPRVDSDLNGSKTFGGNKTHT